MNRTPRVLGDPEDCAKAIVERLDGRIVMGLPLGTGKPNHLVNALYERARRDASLQIEIFTALTLEPPRGAPGLERRFLGPVRERLYAGYPELAYARDRRQGQLPPNVTVTEFYLAPGRWLNVPGAQQAYVSSNYTHVLRDLLDRGVNLLAQLVAVGEESGRIQYSLGSNPDLSLDLIDAKANDDDFLLAGEVSRAMPFMPNDARVDPGRFHFILESERRECPLFPVLNRPVGVVDYAAGLHVSSLIPDGGTLQVGIGSMGDAVANALLQRQHHNREYRQLLDDLTDPERLALRERLPLETGEFRVGLHGASEMLVHSFAGLREGGILRRRVYDDLLLQQAVNALGDSISVSESLLVELERRNAIGKHLSADDVAYLRRFGVFREEVQFDDGRLRIDGTDLCDADLSDPECRQRIVHRCLGDRLRNGRFLEAAFFLGPNALYRWLRERPQDELSGINMTRVSRVNQLYGDEALRRAQRVGARFINEAMMVTLLGGAVSDGLADGRVVSGVGGQFNFVSMGHALEDGRSIIVLPATRESGGRTSSNLVWNYAHITIPRHLRDVVVTEYGVADLRGKSDRDVIAALLAIADSRFQSELLREAQRAGKIEADYSIPDGFRRNLPDALEETLLKGQRAAWFPHFPWATELTSEEAALAVALGWLKRRVGDWRSALRVLLGTLPRGHDDFTEEIARMGLTNSLQPRDLVQRRLLKVALHQSRRDGRPLTPSSPPSA